MNNRHKITGKEIMNQKKIHSIIIVGMMLLSVAFIVCPIVNADNPHAVKGIVYVNDEIPESPEYENILVKIIFTEDTYSEYCYEYNNYNDDTNYNVGFFGHDGETADIVVEYYGVEYIPVDNTNVSIDPEVWGYYIVLHIESPENLPPNAPTLISPSNGATGVDINPTLSASVSDSEGDTMDVTFYNASDDSVIDTATGVSSGSTASVTWSGLAYETTYSWYAIASDAFGSSPQSTIWSFTTAEQDIEPPSKVTGLTVTDAKDGKLDLSWNAATDNVAVDYYNIYHNGPDPSPIVVDHPTITYTHTGLTNGQEYTYNVSAVDTSGNEGESSDPQSGTPTETTGNGGNGGNGDNGGNGGGTPNELPTANASAGEPYTGTPGENITFDGSLSSDPEGTDLDYRWDFDGDGTYDTEWLENATVIHAYDSE